jgi:tripartite-type tricarboxylate transporter receptor subunit TctC
MGFFVRAVLVALVAFAACAQAQNYPAKPIRLVVPFPPAGSGDVVARMVGHKLTEAWGQQVVVDFKAGAGGNIGAENVARSPGDGYTLLLGIDTQMVVLPHIYKNLPYNADRDFVPVAPVAYIGYVLVVPPSIPGTTLKEVVAHFKAHPGKYSYASLGIGSIHHLSTEMLMSVAGINLVHVPYKGAAQTLVDLIAGEIHLVYTGIPQSIAHVKNGRVKAIGLGSAQRLDAMPGVPTIGETYPGFETTSSWYVFAPAGTPRAIVTKLNEEINRILVMPDVVARLNSQGLFIIGGSPEALAARVKTDYEKWGGIIKKLNIKQE